MKFTSDELRKFVETNPKLVSRHQSTTYPDLYVLKYKRKVFYDNLWCPELMEMRGMVVDKDYNIVVWPFTKIFNHGENNTTIDPKEKVIAVSKINGFMACLTKLEDGRQIISTTGSLDSEYVGMARNHLDHIVVEPGYTFIFEICDIADPHIIPEVQDAYLIGGRRLSSGQMMSEEALDHIADKLLVNRPEWDDTETFGFWIERMKSYKKEGIVVYGNDVTLKMKSPFYLVSKFLARKTNLFDVLNSVNPKATVDEEFYPLIDHIKTNQDFFIGMNEQDRLQYIRDFYK